MENVVAAARVRSYTLSVHDKHTRTRSVRLRIARQSGAKENRLDGEKVARRRHSQAYRCQSVSWKSLTAPKPSRILHFLLFENLSSTVTPPFAILLAQLSTSFSYRHPLFTTARRETPPPSEDGMERSYTANQFTAAIRTGSLAS